jgi:cyclic-di-GMP-binding protein
MLCALVPSVPGTPTAGFELDANGNRRLMFKWLARQFNQADEDADSLASERGLETFIAALPVTVPARTIEALGEPFENARSLGLAPEQLRRALKRLDERAQEALDPVWDSLFEDEQGRKLADGPWLVLARFYRNVAAGYEVCLQDLRERSEHSDAERSDAVLIACRAMAALGRYKALMRMRYRDVEAGYWDRLHDLAAWSYGFGGARTLIELYPRSGHQSSLEREYLMALIYEAAPIANMLPAQMAGLESLLHRLATHFQFSDNYRDSTPFVTEPGRDPGVRRFLKGLNPRPGQRFFGVGTSIAQLAALRKKATQEVPEWLARAHLDLASYRNLLDLLLQHWSAQPPQRRHRRDRAEGEVLVSHGVAQVRRMIAASEYAKAGGQLSYEENTPYDHKLFGKLRFGSVEQQGSAQRAEQPQASPLQMLEKFELEGDRQMTERWLLTDVSAGGFGAVAATHGGWGRTGMLIGFRRVDSLDWQIALIRRLSRSAEGRLSIGAQAIAGATACARVRFGSGDAGNPWVAVSGTTDTYHDAILLRSEHGARLLLTPGVFSSGQDCMLSFERVWHRARLERALEQGYDFDLVEVRVSPAGAGP